MARPLYINELREGHVAPVDASGGPAPVDLTKPFEYQASDPDVVDLAGVSGEPLRFTCRFKVANVPVTLKFLCHNVLGEQITCQKTYTAENPPPPPVVAVGGTLEIED